MGLPGFSKSFEQFYWKVLKRTSAGMGEVTGENVGLANKVEFNLTEGKSS